MNSEQLLNGLNDGQREAVKHIKGPALCTASAGSGKTKVVITRASYMISNGIDPSKILLTTFTNKAANEMKERIVNNIGERGKRITVGTYHSICNRILRQYGDKIGYNKTFTIIDENDADKIIKEISKKYNIEYQLAKSTISAHKSHYLTPQQAANDAKTETERHLAEIYDQYQEELKRQMAMDFDDLIFYTY